MTYFYTITHSTLKKRAKTNNSKKFLPLSPGYIDGKVRLQRTLMLTKTKFS